MEEIKTIASAIEHTALKADLLIEDVSRICNEALEHQFAGVCLPPFFVQDAHKILEESGINLVTVIGFPFGFSCTGAKIEEAKKAFNQGADHIDVVVNIGAVKNGRWSVVKDDVGSLATLAHLNTKKIKLIIETALLSDDEKKMLCEIAAEKEMDYVKTSTGFQKGGATVEDVKLLRKHLPPQVKIKASGGIKTREMALDLLKAGADRLGTSGSLKLINS